MYVLDEAADLAAEVASQAASIVPGWVPIALSAVAIAIALVSAWINWQAASPRLAVRLHPEDQYWEQSYIRFRVVNEGSTWVEGVRVKWGFDPMNLRFHAPSWTKDVLMPGEYFIATMTLPMSYNPGDDPREQHNARMEEYSRIVDEDDGKRRFGVASYKRQIRLPFVRTRQRIAIPVLPDGYTMAAFEHFQKRAAQQD